MAGLARRFHERFYERDDIAQLVVFRVLFGLLMSVSALRFVANGWVERFFGQRTFHFHYWGFAWLEPGPVWVMYGVYGALALLGACVALGLYYRVAIALFFVLFSYAELTDVTNYLNHYYLVSLLALLMSFMPLSGAGSLDAWLRPHTRQSTVPRGMLLLLRFQVAVVYLGAALAKVGSDWLVHGQPLNIWLTSHADTPWIGQYLGDPRVALLASWGGFLHDLLVVPALLWRRSRPYAYALLLFFHVTTSTWFNIGIFPVLMPIAATLFFEPSWPRDGWARVRCWLGWGRVGGGEDVHVAVNVNDHVNVNVNDHVSGGERGRWRLGAVAIAAYCVLQVALPLRTYLYGGNVLWHEQGMRYSWRVMLRSKFGSISYRVRLRDGRELFVNPRKYLSSEQEREMSGQPDLILQLAQHVHGELAARGHGDAQVFVDAWVSLNGRKPARLIDPRVDLARVSDGLGFASWITPEPRDEPVRLEPAHSLVAVVK
jgi:hypothetical protein